MVSDPAAGTCKQRVDRPPYGKPCPLTMRQGGIHTMCLPLAFAFTLFVLERGVSPAGELAAHSEQYCCVFYNH